MTVLSVGGHKFFASGEQMDQLRSKSLGDLVRAAEAVKVWAEQIAEADGAEEPQPNSHQWRQLELNANAMIKAIDFFHVVRGHYIDGPVRRAFERNDRGEIIDP